MKEHHFPSMPHWKYYIVSIISTVSSIVSLIIYYISLSFSTLIQALNKHPGSREDDSSAMYISICVGIRQSLLWEQGLVHGKVLVFICQTLKVMWQYNIRESCTCFIFAFHEAHGRSSAYQKKGGNCSHLEGLRRIHTWSIPWSIQSSRGCLKDCVAVIWYKMCPGQHIKLLLSWARRKPGRRCCDSASLP